MGEVYRARDPKLGRDVAIKILPSSFAGDPDRLARFEREARVLASLNHPHIAQIYGLEGQAIVMELVDGDTLADRIRRGPLKVHDALAIARQIADALDAAHEKGIVHRDLKPSNIALTHDGAVKILDFGLAKDAPDELRAADLTHSPTMMAPTMSGVLLGTAPYMSPEQARGKAVDKRTDIWAFGCVLYEMLTGRRAFAGETTTDTVAAILEREPDWMALPSSLPLSVTHVLKRCLEKDPKRRQRDIADARVLIDDPAVGMAPTSARPARAGQPVRTVAAAIVALLVAFAATLYYTMRFSPAPQTRFARVERVTFDAGITQQPALSRDGQLLAFASDRSGRGNLDIWVQQRSGASPIRVTDDEADDSDPSFSPDGSQIVFRSERNGGGVYVVPALGGTARLVVNGGRNPRFSPDGTRLAYWTGQFRGAIAGTASATFVAPLTGGAPVAIAKDFVVARNPIWSPDGKALLFVGRRNRELAISEGFDLWYVPLDGAVPSRTGILGQENWRAQTMAELTTFGEWTASGLLVASRGSLWSVPLAADGTVAGAPVQLALGSGLYLHPTAGRDGQIIFGDLSMERRVERARIAAPADPPVELLTDGNPTTARTSQTRDGTTIVYERIAGARVEIWDRNVRTGQAQLLHSVDSSNLVYPTVSSDGSLIAYTVMGATAQSVTVDGDGFVFDRAGGIPRPLCKGCGVYEFLSGGRHVVVTKGDAAIQVVDIGDQSARDIVTSPTRIERPSVSPDDRIIAFRRTVNSVAKVFVGRVPGTGERPLTPDTAQQIDEPTTTGRPAGWSPDSRILYLLLDSDGHRCLWGQRVSPDGRLEGKPFAARHFHDRRSIGISTSLGNAISPEGFLYETVATRGNLWTLLRER